MPVTIKELEAQLARSNPKTSSSSSGSAPGLINPSSFQSSGGKPCSQSPRKSIASAKRCDTDMHLNRAVRKASPQRFGSYQSKDQATSALERDKIEAELSMHSFGKRVNIVSGREPRLPKSLLEGRRSDRMMQLKERNYNEDDWFDHPSALKKEE